MRTVADDGDRASFYLRAATVVQPGTTVVIDEAVLSPGPGWLVIHVGGVGMPGIESNPNTRAGEILGVSPLLAAGTTTDVTVTLGEALVPGDAILAMLHVEGNADGTFDYPGPDGPALVGGDMVMVPIEVAGGPGR